MTADIWYEWTILFYTITAAKKFIQEHFSSDVLVNILLMNLKQWIFPKYKYFYWYWKTSKNSPMLDHACISLCLSLLIIQEYIKVYLQSRCLMEVIKKNP